MEPLYRQAHSLAHRARDFVFGRQWTPRWSRVEANPAEPDVLEGVRLFAVLATYNEEDVVEASVRNALAQGAERVYLVDNASTDDTVARAVAAGATLAERFETTCVEDRLRTMLMNTVVWHVSSAERDDHLWWLWTDADEFSHGPGTTTLVEYLRGLDRRFRAVGANYFQHFPHTKPEYLPGFHPLDFQPLCEPFWQAFSPRCTARHYKHPLQRFDRAGPFVLAPNCFHTWAPNDKSQLVEPSLGIVTHHFPYRDEQRTRQRLEAIYGPVSGRGDQMLRAGSTGGHRRRRSLDAVYSQDWGGVDNDRHVPGDAGVRLRPWKDVAAGAEPARWYTPEDLGSALRSTGGRPVSPSAFR